jgi:hypothetical protein
MAELSPQEFQRLTKKWMRVLTSPGRTFYPWRQVNSYINKQTKARFQLHMSPTGEPWPRARVKVKARGKRRRNRRRARRTVSRPALKRSRVSKLARHMSQSTRGKGRIIDIYDNGRAFQTGTVWVGARKQQEGFEDVPAREHFGLNGMDMKNIVNILADRVMKELDKGGF